MLTIYPAPTLEWSPISKEETKRRVLAWHDKAIAHARHKDGEDYKDRLEKAIAAAQTNGVVWAISLLDELHRNDEGGETTDQLFKILKNTIYNCYKTEAGIDLTPFMDDYDRIVLARSKQKDSM